MDVLAARTVMESAPNVHDSRDALDPTYLQLFLLKYLCCEADCFGTFILEDVGSNVHVCNVCSRRRTEEEFLADLEAQLEEEM